MVLSRKDSGLENMLLQASHCWKIGVRVLLTKNVQTCQDRGTKQFWRVLMISDFKNSDNAGTVNQTSSVCYNAHSKIRPSPSNRSTADSDRLCLTRQLVTDREKCGICVFHQNRHRWANFNKNPPNTKFNKNPTRWSRALPRTLTSFSPTTSVMRLNSIRKAREGTAQKCVQTFGLET